MGFIPPYVPQWVVGVCPVVVVDIVPAAESLDSILDCRTSNVEHLESVGMGGMGGASWVSSLALPCEHCIHIHASTAVGSAVAAASSLLQVLWLLCWPPGQLLPEVILILLVDSLIGWPNDWTV